MQMTKSQIAIVGLVGVIILLAGLALIFGRKSTPPPPPPKTQINFWGFKADESAWKNVITLYEAANPTVSINLTSVDPANYESNLIDSLAAGTGPDVLMFHYDWMSKHKNKISPAENITPEIVGNLFPKAVSEDFVADNKVYALPVSMNTMALAYNRDYFDAKGVPNAPATWDDVKTIIPKLRELVGGKIVKSAISIGAAQSGNVGNIKNADDLLTLMLLQNGVNLLGDPQHGGGIESPAGLSTLNYYLDFSNPASKNFAFYAGTAQSSLDSFAAGNTAMVFVYPQDLQYIKSKNPVLNYKVVPMPQLNPNTPVNLTDYWGLSVSNRTANSALAWDFISFAATNDAPVKAYVSGSGNQPALRSLLASFNPDPVIGVFAPQVLNAVSFPKVNKDGFRAIIDNMIESSLKDRSGSNIASAAISADAAIQGTIQK